MLWTFPKVGYSAAILPALPKGGAVRSMVCFGVISLFLQVFPVWAGTAAVEDTSDLARRRIADLIGAPAETDVFSVAPSDWEESRKRLRGQVDQWLERLESGRLEGFAIRLVDDMLFTNTGVLAQGRAWDFDAELPSVEERREFVQKVLEPERYQRLAQALRGYAVGDRPPSNERDLAVAFLGKALAYYPLAGLLQQELERMPEGKEGSDAKRRRAALAIAMLFLDADPSPRTAATELLAERSLSSRWRGDLFVALYRTGNPEQRDATIQMGVEADDAMVLYEILGIERAGSRPPDVLRNAMLVWHGRIVDEVTDGVKPSDMNESLYMRLTTRLFLLGRRGDALSEEERRGLADQCWRMLAVGSPQLRHSAVGLLESVGDEAKDGSRIGDLLGDPQTNVRSRAALAIGRSFPDTRKRHLAVLVGLLNDPDTRLRDFSLYALWREHESEKAHVLFTPKNFEQQKAATLAWLKEHRDIEPAKTETQAEEH